MSLELIDYNKSITMESKEISINEISKVSINNNNTSNQILINNQILNNKYPEDNEPDIEYFKDDISCFNIMKDEKVIKINMSNTIKDTRKVYMSFPEKCVQGFNNTSLTFSNYIKTTKYTLLTFLPLNIFEQFLRAANFYFLLMVIIVLIPYISSIEPYTSIMPLVFVLSVTAIKEAIEDHKRYVSDTQINSRMSYLVADPKILAEQHAAQQALRLWYSPILDLFLPPSYNSFRHTESLSGRSVEAETGRNRHTSNRASLSVKSSDFLYRIAWEDIRVGDILRVDEGQEFPVDLVLLSSSEPTGTCSIVTANLDGETNLKTVNSVPDTSKLTNAIEVYSKYSKKAWVECELPNSNMHNFEGVFFCDEQSEGTSLTKDNILLRGASLQNTAHIYGLCIYTGHETKLFLNSNEPAMKRSNVDRTVNFLMYTIFLMLFCVCMITGIGSGLWKRFNTVDTYTYLRYSQDDISLNAAILGIENFFAYSVLFSLMVPISLYVSIELVKVFQAYLITCDLQMYDDDSGCRALARTSNLNEELGQIEYVFSDKTGTLTQNQMAFYQCSLKGVKFGLPNESTAAEAKAVKTPDFMFYDPNFAEAFKNGDAVTEEFLLCLALCHGCNIATNDAKTHTKYKYVSSSPDEVSLVGAAANLGIVFSGREGKFVFLEFPKESRLQKYAKSLNQDAPGVPTLSYEILDVIEFTSERRRMTVLVRCPDGTVKLYSKGADSSIIPNLVDGFDKKMIDDTKNHLEEYSVQGLRTLCIANRTLDNSVYDAWGARYLSASREIGDRKGKMAAVAEEIEHEFILLGATAIEDKLQDGVPECISKLRMAGIKVWVLTGDKRETAINIGKSCQLIDSSLKLFTIEGNSAGEVAVCLRKVLASLPKQESAVVSKNNNPSNDIPLIEIRNSESSFRLADFSPWDYKGIAIVADGQALHYTFAKATCRDLFLELIKHPEFKVCICARMAPKQKASIVQLVKENLNAVTLAIGDGANDVSMIQAAHIGIGISGKEGRQAVNSSDYAIGQFRFLSRLLLVHGRYSYKRTTKLILFSFFKNMVVSYTQLWFACYSGFSGMEFYDGLLLNTFNVFFTSLPILFIASFDRECTTEEQHAYPALYFPGRLRRGFGLEIFWRWLLTGFRDSFVVFWVPYFTLSYTTSANDLPSISVAIYTIVIIVVNIKIFFFVSSWTWPNFAISFFSIVLYFFFIVIYCSAPLIDYGSYLLGVPAVIFSEAGFWLSLIFCVVVTFLPEYIAMYYLRITKPSLKHVIQERRLVYGENAANYVDYAAPEWGRKISDKPSDKML